ncbi:MAG: right-handed parallel beta-helix repeat-containing protein [Rudaea sp.]
MKTTDILNWKVRALILLVAVLMAVPAVAANFEICVTNNADLKTALDQAQNVAVTVKMARGTYDLKNTVWHNFNNFPVIRSGSEVLGGYSADCSSRNIAVGNTVVTDSAIADDGPFALGDLTVEGLTFSLTKGRIEFIAGNPNFYNAKAGSTITLRRNAFLNGAADDIGGVFWYGANDSNGTVRLVNNLYAGNSASSCTVFLQVERGNPKMEFINNTVINNSVTASGIAGVCFTAIAPGVPTYYAYNNIIYGTTGTGGIDLYSDTNQVILNDNIVGTRNGFTPILSSGELSANPKLDSTYHPIEVPQSPAINSGNNSPPDGLPSTDLDGGARVVGSVVDRGAYESSIDPNPVQTVTKVADDGSTGTLRAAINSVNSNGGGTIKFNIGTGCGPHVITLTAANGELPGLTANATVNGYSQVGASVNTLDVGDDANICIILEAGTGANAPARGLVVSSGAPSGASVTIKGLAFSNFATTGIDLQGGSQHAITGNHFGGSVSGYVTKPNGFDIRLGAGTQDNTIGSEDIADRNIIGDATGSGIVVANGSANNQIIGNYIGVGWGGTNYTNRSNGARGIYVGGDNNTISANLIGYNAQAGIVVDGLGGHDNLIENNFIGADADGVDVGNVAGGVHLIGDSSGSGDAPANNTIRLNTIADNGAQGVLVDVGRGNRIRKNSSFGNAMLGIDLGNVGVTPNDDDGGLHTVDDANRLQNFPLITSAQGGYAKAAVTGSLTTTPGVYTVDFYNSPACDSSGNGEGKFWLGSASVTVPVPTIGNQGTAPISVTVDQAPSTPLVNGSKINSTATDANGNTSEFSTCANYLNDTLFTDGFEAAAQ